MTIYGCRVLAAGPVRDGQVRVRLREGGNQFDASFIAPDAVRREMLAVALSAISSGLAVYVDLPNTNEGTEINWMYLAGG